MPQVTVPAEAEPMPSEQSEAPAKPAETNEAEVKPTEPVAVPSSEEAKVES